MNRPLRQSLTGLLLKVPLLTGLLTLSTATAVSAERPNILWLFAEDTSPWMGCYGDPINAGETPHIDSLADRGIRFSRAFVPAPVCSPCRSAVMVGQNQIRFGAHEHRSSRGPVTIRLPEGVKLLPQLIRESGYFTFNLGKTDYNFAWDEEATYSLSRRRRSPVPWETLQDNQPFFGQIQTAGGKNNTAKFPDDRKVDPSKVTVPPDYPQNRLYHEVVAEHYDSIRMDDDFVGEVLRGLRDAGLADNTIVVYFSDHGANNLVRHKQMPTEGGLHVPFIISGPRHLVPGQQVRDDLVNLLDLSATTLAWAGLPIPDWYEGQDLFGEIVKPRIYVAAAKDRLDHTIDRVRSIRSDRYRYTRNYKTDRIFLQPQYRDSRDYVKNLRELDATGQLSPKLTEIYFGERPAEELYDIVQDPHQLRNLAGDPGYTDVLAQHREWMDEWLSRGDAGADEEPKAELAYQAEGHKWGEGVNPEYEIVRTDSDGDGVSDAWERINGREPADGRVVSHFDCGGWQTEGWHGVGIDDNIAGRLGFLDFRLGTLPASLRRDGMKLSAKRNRGPLVVRIRTSRPLQIQLAARPAGASFEPIGRPIDVLPSESFRELSFPLAPSDGWHGTFEAIELRLQGPGDAWVEVDSISVQ